MEQEALAKLNLTLDVLGRRPDGYHDMKMVMQSISLTDRLTVLLNGGHGLRVVTSSHFLPQGEKNLAGKAALAFYAALEREMPGVDVTLVKRIPICAGMAGGSSDAAAVLRALNELEGTPFTPAQLARVGETVGSDVPFCVLGGTALAEGRGEILTPLPALPPCWLAVCKPEFPISTPELFNRLDGMRVRRRPDTEGVLAALEAGDLAGVARRMYNVFEDVLPPRQSARVEAIRSELIQLGAMGACMTGTGPTVFGLFETKAGAEEAVEKLKQDHRETFLARPV